MGTFGSSLFNAVKPPGSSAIAQTPKPPAAPPTVAQPPGADLIHAPQDPRLWGQMNALDRGFLARTFGLNMSNGQWGGAGVPWQRQNFSGPDPSGRFANEGSAIWSQLNPTQRSYLGAIGYNNVGNLAPSAALRNDPSTPYYTKPPASAPVAGPPETGQDDFGSGNWEDLFNLVAGSMIGGGRPNAGTTDPNLLAAILGGLKSNDRGQDQQMMSPSNQQPGFVSHTFSY